MKQTLKYTAVIFFILFNLMINPEENFKIDWSSGKIYSTAVVKIKGGIDLMNERVKSVESAKEETKTGFYKALEAIQLYESKTVLDYFEERSEKNRELYFLINNAKLFKMEYPDLNTIKLTYFIPIFGDGSIMSLMLDERNVYTEDLNSYFFYPYSAEYTGIIIDARTELTSFDGFKVKVKPSLFISVKDEEGKIVFDQYNVLPNVIKEKGMALYSYNVKDDFLKRAGTNPLRVAAFGAGDKTGSVIVVTLENAKKMLSSDILRKAIKNGNIVVIVDK